jgi:hypothetical protein
MSGKLEKTLNSVYGTPASTSRIAFTDTVTSGVIDANEMLYLAADQDCHIKFINPGVDTQADTDSMYLPKDKPIVLSSTTRETYISVVRKTNSGNLYVTKLKVRG